jgi:hypothetical protein
MILAAQSPSSVLIACSSRLWVRQTSGATERRRHRLCLFRFNAALLQGAPLVFGGETPASLFDKNRAGGNDFEHFATAVVAFIRFAMIRTDISASETRRRLSETRPA